MSLSVDRERLRQQLIVHEGLRTHAYVDTVGKLTIGVGRNLTDKGITRVEALYLLDHDIDHAIQDLEAAFPWVVSLDPVRQAVLVDMSFNLGITKLKGFVNTMKAVEQGRWQDAASGMRNSLWARQVGYRATKLARMMVTGMWPSELSA